MTTLPAYALLTLAAYAFLRRCIGFTDIALLALLVLVAVAYGIHTQSVQRDASGGDTVNSGIPAAEAAFRASRGTGTVTTVPTPPATLGQTVVPSRPASSRGRGTVYSPSAFERAVSSYPDLRAAWRRLERVYAQEGPVPLSQRNTLQVARDAFVDNVRALRRFARVSEVGMTRHRHDDADTTSEQSSPRVPDPRHRLAMPSPRRRHPQRRLSKAQRQAAVIMTYTRLKDAFDGLRLQVLPMEKDARRAEAAMDQICATLEAVDTGDVYSAQVPEPVNVRL